MSEEESDFSEQLKTERYLELCESLEELGESILAHQLFNKVKKQLKEVKLEGDSWLDTQICLSFPKIDRRCLAFCCTPKKPCPFRQAALQLFGLSKEQYVALKRGMGELAEFDRVVVPAGVQ